MFSLNRSTNFAFPEYRFSSSSLSAHMHSTIQLWTAHHLRHNSVFAVSTKSIFHNGVSCLCLGSPAIFLSSIYIIILGSCIDRHASFSLPQDRDCLSKSESHLPLFRLHTTPAATSATSTSIGISISISG